MHTFSLGPSGAGKSYLSEKLADTDDLLLMEADLWPPEDGMLHYGLKAQWDSFYEHFDPAPLHAELDTRAAAVNKSGVVVSFPGFPLLCRKHVEVSTGIFRIVYFAGSPGQCLDAFLERERISGRGLTIQHWASHVGEFFTWLAAGEVAANTIYTFATDGAKRPFKDIYDEIHAIVA